MIQVFHSTKQNALATKLQHKELIVPRETLREEGQMTSKLAGFIKECAKLNDLSKGVEIEKEHERTYNTLKLIVKKTGQLPPAKEMYTSIACDHLNEFPNYYKHLPAFEKSLSKTASLNDIYLNKYAYNFMPGVRQGLTKLKGMFSGARPLPVMKHPSQLLASEVRPEMVPILEKFKKDYAAISKPKRIFGHSQGYQPLPYSAATRAQEMMAGGAMAY